MGGWQRRTQNCYENSGNGLFYGIIPVWMDYEKPWNTSVHIASLQAKIWT
jgi:hypothetical protein